MPANKDDHQPVVENDDQPDRHRAGPGEGVRAPSVSEGADHAEMSVFDGAGNESVVVVADDEEGKVSEGTGASSAEAMADAKEPDHRLGEGFQPGR